MHHIKTTTLAVVGVVIIILVALVFLFQKHTNDTPALVQDIESSDQGAVETVTDTDTETTNSPISNPIKDVYTNPFE